MVTRQSRQVALKQGRFRKEEQKSHMAQKNLAMNDGGVGENTAVNAGEPNGE